MSKTGIIILIVVLAIIIIAGSVLGYRYSQCLGQRGSLCGSSRTPGGSIDIGTDVPYVTTKKVTCNFFLGKRCK